VQAFVPPPQLRSSQSVNHPAGQPGSQPGPDRVKQQAGWEVAKRDGKKARKKLHDGREGGLGEMTRRVKSNRGGGGGGGGVKKERTQSWKKKVREEGQEKESRREG
ncbi:hypothetical protein GBF38_018866, partial [Nibea albiflora]